jgi:iron complex transport system substrate-binding protein
MGLIAMGLVLKLGGCGSSAPPTAAAESSKASEPDVATKSRLVVLGGGLTEIVYALGHGADVVAVDTTSVFPAEADALPDVGYVRNVSAEGILATTPTLVLASSTAGPKAVLDRVAASGATVTVIDDPTDLDGAYARVLAVGEALGEVDAATTLVATMKTEVEAAQRDIEVRVQARGRPRALFVYARGTGTMLVSGAGTPADAMLTTAGATNALADVNGFVPVSGEAIVASQAEVIVLPKGSLDGLGGTAGVLAIPGIAETPAGKAKAIVAIDDAMLLGYGPRIGAALRALDEGFAALPATDTTATKPNALATSDVIPSQAAIGAQTR